MRGNYAQPDEELPSAWGYQNVGRVIEAGPEVRELEVGDLVYLGDLEAAGHVEWTVLPEDTLLIKLPDGVSPMHAALFGMSSVAMRACRAADLRLGERFLIVGAGFLGQMAAQVARAMGARPTICDLDDARLELATQIGAVEDAVNSAGAGWDRLVRAGGFDALIDVAGAPGMEDRLLEAVRWRGRVLLVAGRAAVHYTFNLGQQREVTIKQTSHFDREDLQLLCDLVQAGSAKISPLIRDVVPVTEARRIYDTLRDEPNKLLGTVFEW